MPAVIGGPHGRFSYRKGTRRQAWIAGGVGVAPFLSWLRALDGDLVHRVDFFYTSDGEPPFAEEIRRIADDHHSLHAHLIDTSVSGRLTVEQVMATAGDPHGLSVFICGPTGMVRTFQTELRAAGVPSRRIHREYFDWRRVDGSPRGSGRSCGLGRARDTYGRCPGTRSRPAPPISCRGSRCSRSGSPGLKPLARVAYNYRWAGPRRPRGVPRHQPSPWALSGENPVRFLGDLWPATQEAAERNPELLERVDGRSPRVAADLARPTGRDRASTARSPSSAPSSASTRRCRSTRAGSACSRATSSRRRATRRCR